MPLRVSHYFTKYCVELKGLSDEEKAWFEKKLAIVNDETPGGPIEEQQIVLDAQYDEGQYTLDFEDRVASHKIRPDADGRWAIVFNSSDEDNNPIAVLQCLFSRFLREFRPDGWILFEWAYGAEPPQLDAYGGGATIVRAKDSDEINTRDWLAQYCGTHGLNSNNCLNR